MIPLGHDVALRAVGTALAGLSVAFASYMLAYGDGKIRVNGLEHLAIFAQPRGSPVAAKAPVLPPLTDPKWPPDMIATGSIGSSEKDSPRPRPVEIVAARADRVWLKIDGNIRPAVPGDDIPGLGRIGAIVPRDDGWALLGDNGETLLAVDKRANGASLFTRNRIFE
jgi:hypothetical protein